MQKFKSVDELVNQLKPTEPVYCIRRNSIRLASKFFQNKFPGKILYAVKTNPHPVVLQTLLDSGIKHYDVASIKEIETIKNLNPEIECSYMHTVKSREDIKEAYFKYNIKTFALDTKDGFHVGSQCMHPISYAKGISEIGNIIKRTKIVPDIINVGGGFPTIYPDLVPQPMQSYFDEIKKGLKNLKLQKLPEIICEPGRSLVAESGSTIVRVNLRKKQKLYINDGTYGTLFDAGTPNIVYPSRVIKNGRVISKKLTSFDFYGPTCDSMDYMKGPFILPNNIKENDYIELGQLGAYGLTFRTQFNGFYSDQIFEVEDDPIMTMYNKETMKEFLVA